MTSGLAQRYANLLIRYSRPVLLVLLLLTVLIGSGAGNIESGLTIASFGSDSTEAQKLDYVQQNFSTGQENTTAMQVVVRGDNVLSKESLLETLRLQRTLRENETVNATLADGQATVGIANQIAIAAIQQESQNNARPSENTTGNASATDIRSGATGSPQRLPTLDEQIKQMESMTTAEVESVTERVLDPSRARSGTVNPYTLLSTDYDAGSTTATARVLFVFQHVEAAGDTLPQDVVQGQLATREIAQQEVSDDTFVFGAGIVDEESGQATGESFAIISPIALAFILLVLIIAYRDIFDIVLALVGVVLVLVWMGGFMGWAGIGVTQIIIAVPFLLIGLSIDYALHVVMRYREARKEDIERTPREGMRVSLAGVTVALAATTFTTAVGFLSNTVSPITSIAEFGLVSAAGIVAAFIVFAALLPTIKIELESLLERVGRNRRKRAFGTSGVANRIVGAGTTIARRIPVAIVVVALLLSAGGGYAATDIDTSLNQVDFLPRDSPQWMDSLPEPFAPSDYSLRENVIFLNENFVQSRDRSTAEILIEGPVTNPRALDRLAAAHEQVSSSKTAVSLANGEPSVESPLSVINQTAATNETVAATVERNDADGDGIPDQNLKTVYDAVYDAEPDRAMAVFHRTNGEYRALRMSVGIKGGADTGVITSEMRTIAATIERNTPLESTATGQPIITELVQKNLLTTLVETFLITLGVILVFLTGIFYRRYGTLSLGAVTMLPVVFALSWILGTMYLLSIPFNSETAIIASIAIGIGVDYAIHISERFIEERQRTNDAFAALDSTVAGTGGALLASAVSTAGGFAVLLFALVPSLQRFGLVTSTAIVYAFVASVVVLPSLLVLWDRHLSDDTSTTEEAVRSTTD
ncbi:efflux RND transporter permease subunit [Haladaptatus sp. DFWS20]|uniref:efflux RND transporter permease subunit n=1 Tax=Haladaptatus sp. DFWS20 TaxID=3403467 RepID=UPI003EB8FE54